jgi:thiol-disulfide isomerase/thioredoxin
VSTGLWVVIVVVALATVAALVRKRRDGRFSQTAADDKHAPESGLLAESPWADGLGARATLVQFSSVFCAPCRVARGVLTQVASLVPGVVHLEVDVADHLDLARRAGVMRTPTTLVLDPQGREIARADGAPSVAQVMATLDRVLAQEA